MITFFNNAVNTSILDYDAREFISVIKLTDQTQVRAINQLCVDLKKAGLWDSFFRCYPFVYNPGFTFSSLYCLKTRLSLSPTTNSGFTYSSTGVEFGLTSSLQFDSSLPFTYNAELLYGGHISIYNRKSTDISTIQSHGEVGNLGNQRYTGPIISFGVTSNGVGQINGSFFNASTYNLSGSTVNSSSLNGSTSNPRFSSFTYSGDNTGLFVYSNPFVQTGTASMSSPFIFYMSKNDSILGVSYSVRNFVGEQVKPRIGNYSSPSGGVGSQSYQEICWFSVGIGDKTSTGGPIEMVSQPNFYKIIQKFQTALGRQV